MGNHYVRVKFHGKMNGDSLIVEALSYSLPWRIWPEGLCEVYYWYY